VKGTEQSIGGVLQNADHLGPGDDWRDAAAAPSTPSTGKGSSTKLPSTTMPCRRTGFSRTSHRPVLPATNVFNNPPAISIVQPTNDAAFSQPINLTIATETSDSDGAVVKVEFFCRSHKAR